MLNKVVLMGRLTAEPELRHTPNNVSVTSFTIAVNRSFSKTGEQTDFIDIVAWQATAEFVTKWFKKGAMIAVCGRIQTRMWEDKQGQKRKSVEVIAEEVSFTGEKKDSQPQNNNAAPFDMGNGNNEFSELSPEDSELPF